eukprot:671134-Amphidinium_carterae.1
MRVAVGVHSHVPTPFPQSQKERRNSISNASVFESFHLNTVKKGLSKDLPNWQSFLKFGGIGVDNGWEWAQCGLSRG